MKTLQQQIQAVEHEIQAEQAFVHRSYEHIKHAKVSPLFISIAVIASLAVGYALLRSTSGRKYLQTIGLALASPVAKRIYKSITS